MSEQGLLEEEGLYAPLGIPSHCHRDWNIRVLDRDDLHEFSQSCGITILYLPLAAGQTHLCLLLSPTRRVLIVANGLSESETIYYAWLGCASLLGKSQKSAHKMALCAAIPKPSLSHGRLKKQRVPSNLIGARYWLAERYGL